MVTIDQARALHEAGVEVGAHSMSHPDLRALDDGALTSELADSRAAIEAITGRPCRTLAYPFGVHDARVERAVGRAGFLAAFTYGAGPWRPFAIPRLPAPATSAGLIAGPARAYSGSP